MSITKHITFLLIIFSFVSCKHVDPNKEVDEGEVKGVTYTSKEIGWTMELPRGWEITTKEQLDQNTKKGMELVKEVAGEIDYSSLKHLISFQKNKFNVFQSTSERYKLSYEGEYEENNQLLKEVIYNTYTGQGIKVDTSSSIKEIDGLDFFTFHIIMYDPKGNIILYQDMYNRHVNGFDFGVNLTYNNETEKKTMEDLWFNSKLKKG